MGQIYYHFVLKNYCQDLLKTRSGKLVLKDMGTVIFATPLEYAFVEVSVLIGKFMGGEYSNESHNGKVCTRQFT